MHLISHLVLVRTRATSDGSASRYTAGVAVMCSCADMSSARPASSVRGRGLYR